MTSIASAASPPLSRQVGHVVAPDERWLSQQAPEHVLLPEVEIVDPHHHVRNDPDQRYLMEELGRDFSSGHQVVATVLVEGLAMYRQSGPEELRPVGETEFACEIATIAETGQYRATRVAQGIVGRADLTLGAAVQDVLEAHIVAGNGRFRGVRHAAAWDPNPTVPGAHTNPGPGLLRRPSFREGARRLPGLNLSFDAWVFHPQLADVIDLAVAIPELSIVLNHLGSPLGFGPYAGQREAIFADWRQSISQLAKLPNVTVKLGGMVVRLAMFDYLKSSRPPDSLQLATLWRPYVETCIEAFGPGRCMFESNFPVDRVGTGYLTLWNAYKRIVSGASPDEMASLFRDTARRVYRLNN